MNPFDEPAVLSPRPPVDLDPSTLELRRLGRWTWETYEKHGWLTFTGHPFTAFTAAGVVRRYRRRLKKRARNEESSRS